MSTPATSTAIDEYDLYPAHEELNVPEEFLHELEARYLRDVLSTLFPHWFVAGNLCIYWEKGNKKRFTAADVMVATATVPRRKRKSYLLWRDPPVRFVMEVASDRTRKIDLDEKPTTYREHVKAEEYFYVDVDRHDFRPWRLGPSGWEEVPAEANGRWRSAVLGVEFGWDEAGLLRVYAADGEMQRTHAEAEERLGEEVRRRREAEARIGEELLRREEEAERRREAEARASATEVRLEEEARRRREAEARAAAAEAERQELERQLAALRAQLQERRE
jgi:hypothetical protein